MESPEDFRSRTGIIVGSAGMDALSRARIAVYGLGGVGAACAMDLVRAGVGSLFVLDFDAVEATNLNRLYFGYIDEVGRPKTEAFRRAALRVNPDIRIDSARLFVSGSDAAAAVDAWSDLHADCVDSLNAKVNLIAALSASGKPFISSMGTAGRLAPERLRLGTLEESSGCPLAKAVRTRLRRMGVPLNFSVVWSDEPPVKPIEPSGSQERSEDEGDASSPRGRQRLTQGSAPFVPQTAGHLMASWIVRTLLQRAPGRTFPSS